MLLINPDQHDAEAMELLALVAGVHLHLAEPTPALADVGAFLGAVEVVMSAAVAARRQFAAS